MIFLQNAKWKHGLSLVLAVLLCLIPVSALATEPDMTTTLKKGSAGEQVKLLQQKLADYRFYFDEISGTYGDATFTAVVAFQMKNFLGSDGIAGPRTLAVLYGDESAVRKRDLFTPATEAILTQTLKKGSSGAQVALLQKTLAEKGYYPYPVNGYYELSTVNAVKTYQRANGLTQDGIAGRNTLTKLYAGSVPVGTASPDASATPDLRALLKLGSTGEQVKLLQARLKELLYYGGEISGVYDDATRLAVGAFQGKNNLTRDGCAGPKTLAKLYSDGAIAATSAPSGTPTASPSATPTVSASATPTASPSAAPSATPNLTILLKKGSTGEQVKLLQQRLKELLYYTGDVDGIYDDAVYAAVKAFQRANGLTQDGLAGNKTLTRLYSAAAKPTSTPTVDPSATPNLTLILKRGSSGAQVILLQRALNDLGYDAGDADGYYDEQVVLAVKDFQRKNRLTVDGMAGPMTLRKLYSGSAVGVEGEATPTPAASGDPGVIATPKPDATTTAQPVTNIILRKGSVGDQVILLHAALKRLGYFSGTVTNVYDSVTVAAVKLFQKTNGLSMDGCAGPITLTLLYSGNAKEAPEGCESESGGTGNTEIFTYVNGENLNYTLRKGQTSVQVGRLQNALRALGLYGTIGSNMDKANYFGDYTLAAVKAYQKSAGLTVDGLAGPRTLTAMYREANGKPIPALPIAEGINYFRYDNGMAYPIENVDWYEGGSGIVPRGAYFTLVDVRTGYTLRCYRMGGTNHIDFEPVSQEDTLILLAAQGGTWNYFRRPVWVVYNGRRIAGSTYSYPHGEQTIKNNGMEGQVCLHILNSRTHGTDHVDESHQACVEEAYQAGLTNTLG
ncbi:MAG: peptidoglycan-binding protein [Christensenellales bacterium]|jgi:peptidoglycan hydrolase-like protein with peptidoglycan-binding domain